MSNVLSWMHSGPHQYTAKDSVDRYFYVKYIIDGDEDRTYNGVFIQVWREVGKEDYQIVRLGLEDLGFKGRYNFMDLQHRIEALHAESVRPEMERLLAQYNRDNDTSDDPAPVPGEDGGTG